MTLPVHIQEIVDASRVDGKDDCAEAIIEFWEKDPGADGNPGKIEEELNDSLIRMACGLITLLNAAGFHEAATHLFAITQASRVTNADIIIGVISHLNCFLGEYPCSS